jgi:hypothetical protein
MHWQKYPYAPLSKISYGQWAEEVPFVEESDRPWAIPLSMSDGTDVFFDPVRQVYVWYGKMWLDGPDGRMRWKHAMGRIESKDFIHWSKPQLVCTPDDEDELQVEFHTTPVFYYSGVYFCLNRLLDRAVGGGMIDVELMLSRDGFAWQRPFRQSFFLPRGVAGAFDSGAVFTNSTPVLFDDEMRFYFGGYSQGATSADNHKHASGVCLAVLPRDRFAGIEPLEKTDLPTQQEPLTGIGQLTLKPVELKKWKRLSLNADAANGSVQIEVVSADGRRLRGFSQGDAVAIRGDSLAHEVAWQKFGLGDLGEGEYLLRLHLKDAIVYALSFGR